VEFAKPFDAKSFGGDGPGVLILPLPYHRLLSDSKVRSIKAWVELGGGLLVLGYYAADTHHGTNISRLTRQWGVSFAESLLMPNGAQQVDTRRHVFTADEQLGIRIPITAARYDGSTKSIVGGVSSLVVLSAASLEVEHASVPLVFRLDTTSNTELWRPKGPLNPDGMRPIIEEWVLVGSQSVPVVVAFKAGRGRVAIAGSWKLAALEYADNLQLVQNLINWLRPQ
jgi:hypothetical protein